MHHNDRLSGCCVPRGDAHSCKHLSNPRIVNLGGLLVWVVQGIEPRAATCEANILPLNPSHEGFVGHTSCKQVSK